MLVRYDKHQFTVTKKVINVVAKLQTVTIEHSLIEVKHANIVVTLSNNLCLPVQLTDSTPLLTKEQIQDLGIAYSTKRRSGE